MANEEELARTNGHGANTSISYNTHTYTGDRLVVIPLKRAFRSGSSLAKEVVVLAAVVVEVVVLSVISDGSGTHDVGVLVGPVLAV